MKNLSFIFAGLLIGELLAALTIPGHYFASPWRAGMLYVAAVLAFRKGLRLRSAELKIHEDFVAQLQARVDWMDKYMELYCPSCKATLPEDGRLPMRRKRTETPTSSDTGVN